MFVELGVLIVGPKTSTIKKYYKFFKHTRMCTHTYTVEKKNSVSNSNVTHVIGQPSNSKTCKVIHRE